MSSLQQKYKPISKYYLRLHGIHKYLYEHTPFIGRWCYIVNDSIIIYLLEFYGGHLPPTFKKTKYGYTISYYHESTTAFISAMGGVEVYQHFMDYLKNEGLKERMEQKEKST